MNRIVREHYPVAKLPEELREGFAPGTDVRVVVERPKVEAWEKPQTGEGLLGEALTSSAGMSATPDEVAEEVLSITDILEEMQDYRVFNGDPVDRVRALRAEWDYRDEFHDRIRRGDLD